MKNFCTNKRIVVLTFAYLILSVFNQNKVFSQCQKLIWSEEFDSSAVNTSKWVYDNGDGCPNNCQWGNKELQYYRSENIELANGNLIITAKKENFSGSEYTSGKIITKGIQAWTYGRFEARMKLPSGKGIWPAFWLLPAENKFGQWPNSGEIDIMEMLGHEPNKIYGSVHFGPPYNHYSEPYVLPTGDFTQDFHVFALEWKKDTLRWFVDDSLYSEKTKSDINPWIPFDEDFYIILNLAVGGNWPGNPDETTTFPQKLEVDYVHVYGSPTLQKIQTKGTLVKNAGDIKFSVANIPGASYNWTIPADANLVSGQGTSSISVDFACNEGDVAVEIQTDCDTANINLPIVFQDLKITGDSIIFAKDTSLTYSVPAMNNTSYDWTLPNGVVIKEGGTTTNNIKLDWGCSEGTITVQTNNVCEIKDLALPVSFKEAELRGFESVQENAAGIAYSITQIPFAQSYEWTVPEDATIASGQGTNQIRVNFGKKAGNIAATMITACDTNVFAMPVLIGTGIIYASFEASTLDFKTWADTKFERIINPFKTAENQSSHVAKTFKSQTAWSGIYADLDAPIDFSSNNTFKMKVFGPVACIIKMKLEAGNKNIEKDANLTLVNQWQELSFDFSKTESGVYTRMTLFFDFGSTTTNDFYFDDIILTNITTTDTKGIENKEFSIFPNPAIDKIKVKSSGENISSITIADLSGRSLSIQKFKPENQIEVNLKNLKAGTYILVINDSKKSFLIHKK